MKILKNRRGLTTMELLVGVVITSIAALVAMNFSLFFYRAQQQVVARLQSEENLLRASYVLQRLFSTASNLDRSAATIPSGTTITGATRGLFTEFRYARLADAPAAENIVAAFHRDTSDQSVTNATRTTFTPVVISYLRPTATTSGVILVTNEAPAAATNLTGSYDKVFFDKVVEFGFTDVFLTRNASGVDIPVGLNIYLKMRHFLTEDMAKWNFCPVWDTNNATAGCAASTLPNYTDIMREIRVTLINQVVDNNPASIRRPGVWERTLGNVYSFPVGINR